MENQTKESEKIVFQRIMSSRSYRRGMILRRVLLSVLIAGGLAVFCAYSITLGIILSVTALIIGAILILTALGNEHTYTVYNTRVVIKRRNDDGSKTVPCDSITSVKSKSAFYENDLCTATICIKAKNGKGKIKQYKMRHVLDYKPIVEFLQNSINGNNTDVD